MNKQELAAKIWETANELRGSMEASEYKDYILGFIFYKYLSEKEVNFLLSKSFEKEDIEELTEEDEEDVKWISRTLGYFIEPKNLFQNWIKMGSDFTVDNVRTALSSFNRNIDPNRRKIFAGVFNTLEQGLSNLAWVRACCDCRLRSGAGVRDGSCAGSCLRVSPAGTSGVAAVCAVVALRGSGDAGSVARVSGVGASCVGVGVSGTSTRTAGRSVSAPGGAVTAAVAQLAAPTPRMPSAPVVTHRRLLMPIPPPGASTAPDLSTADGDESPRRMR